jgi:Bifunctional DNA primase/polymerase, N-terminal
MSILTGAQCSSLKAAATAYLLNGFSAIPLIGKKCPIRWELYQHQRADVSQIHWWEHFGKLKNIGIVCGAVSGNLIVIDLDGESAEIAFYSNFPELVMGTFCVQTGAGAHVYLYCDKLPTNRKVVIGKGNHSAVEIRGNGQYIVAPPSIHPNTRKPYTVAVNMPICSITQPGLSRINLWLDDEAKKYAPVMPPAATKAPPAATAKARTNVFWPAQVSNPQAWTEAAVSRECQAVKATNEGARNDRLNAAAYNLGQIVGLGWLTSSGAEGALLSAGVAAGLSESEALKTIQSGLRRGIESPRDEQWQKRRK